MSEVKQGSSRYPYTEAYDFIRMHTREHNAKAGMHLPIFSRSDCARICHAIAPALNLTPEALAMLIADHARANGSLQA